MIGCEKEMINKSIGACFMNRKAILNTVLALMILPLAACTSTSTSLTRTWKGATVNEKTINSIMVIGVAKQSDVRQRFEDLFVDAFQKKGVTSAAAYRIVPESNQLTLENITDYKGIIKGAADKNHLEAVLITHLISVKEEEDELKAHKYEPGPSKSYRDMGAYHIYVFQNTRNTYSTNRAVDRKYVRLRTNLYDTVSEKMIWSASSASVDPDSVDTIIQELIDAIIDQLMADDLIGS